jgi:hypothetical protein
MPGLSAHNDDRGELVNRGGDAMETPVANASPFNFLAWFPSNAPANAGATIPAGITPEQTVGAPGRAGTLVGDFTNMVSGVHEHGCGFGATNEAWYRFLVQPDPFQNIVLGGSAASEVGVARKMARSPAGVQGVVVDRLKPVLAASGLPN